MLYMYNYIYIAVYFTDYYKHGFFPDQPLIFVI